MVDIVLVRCRNLTELNAVKLDGRGFPALGVLYIQSYLRKRGCEAVVLDRYAEEYIDLSPEEFVERIHALSPRFVGFSALTSQETDAEKLAACSKARYPHVPVILGGVHFSSLPAEGLKVADYVVIGDGEEATAEILAGVHLPGVVNGKLVKLDDIPFPTAADFLKTSYRPDEIRYFHLITARGCPFNCYFCKDGIRGSAVRHHSVEYVGEMFEYVVREFGVRWAFILDDIFIPTEERLHAYLEEFKRRDLKLKLKVFFHPNVVREKLLPLFWELGVRKISVGIESGAPEILEQMGKRTDRKIVIESTRLLHSYGFEVNGLFILGHRGETPETMQQTLDFARELSLSKAWFSYMVPFPGTPLWDDGVDRHGKIINTNTADWGNTAPVFVPKGLSLAQLEAGMQEAQQFRVQLGRRRKLGFRKLRASLRHSMRTMQPGLTAR